MKRVYPVLALLSFIIIINNACSKSSDDPPNNTVDCSTAATSWANNVSPIVNSTCNQVGCHGTGSNNGPGPLTNYSQVFAARSSIRAAVLSGAMPQNSTLSTSQKNSIICWIDSGAPQN